MDRVTWGASGTVSCREQTVREGLGAREGGGSIGATPEGPERSAEAQDQGGAHACTEKPQGSLCPSGARQLLTHRRFCM